MFDVFKAFATDEGLENSGKKIDLGGGAYMTVARIGNENFNRVLQSKLEKHRESLDGLPDDEKAKLDKQLYLETLAETVLVDFKLNFKGKPMKYSMANAVKLLEIKDFRAKVGKEAENIDNYRAVMEDEAEKN